MKHIVAEGSFHFKPLQERSATWMTVNDEAFTLNTQHKNFPCVEQGQPGPRKARIGECLAHSLSNESSM
ncbi:hypothetical protein AS159_01440 [Thermotoga sp. Ku-13t]|nr:hypothetical protein AS159_01440 [Thermotoga sp. Ku-13t]